jgi:hypothetical protein
MGTGWDRSLSRAAPRDCAVLPVEHLARWWVRGLVNPVAVMRALLRSGRPKAGLAAVVTRFTVQDLVQTLPLELLGRRPFIPAKLPIAPDRHYRAQLVFLPVFGMGQWLLMGSTVHGLLRLAGERSDLSRVLDVIGVGMLIPMPPLGDGAVRRRPAHGGGRFLAARPAGAAASVVYVLGASRFLR